MLQFSLANERGTVYNLFLHVQTIDVVFSYMIRVQSLGREERLDEPFFFGFFYASTYWKKS
jgi:hypothetical protein